MTVVRACAALTLTLGASPALAAPTSWTALQKSSTPGSSIEQSAEVSYGHHRLRIDNPDQRLVIDFESGALLYIDVAKKQYARVTLEEMVALRDKQLKAVKAQLDQMPPEVRKQMEAQIAEAEKSSGRTIDAEATGTKDEVNGIACEMYAWEGSDGEGRACIAKKVPFDQSAFRKDSRRLAKKMEKLGAGSAAASMAILQLGELGFPILIDQKLKMGPQMVAVVATFENLKAKKLPKSHFTPPKGFKKRDFEKMMMEQVNAPPKMPAPKKK